MQPLRYQSDISLQAARQSHESPFRFGKEQERSSQDTREEQLEAELAEAKGLIVAQDNFCLDEFDLK